MKIILFFFINIFLLHGIISSQSPTDDLFNLKGCPSKITTEKYLQSIMPFDRIWEVEYIFDQNCNNISTVKYFEKKISDSTVYKYNSEGLVSNQIHVFSPNKKSNTIDFKYLFNEEGKISSVYKIYANQGYNMLVLYTYNKGGKIEQIISKRIFKKDSTQIISQFLRNEYNEEEQVDNIRSISIKYYQLHRFNFSYNEKGDVVRELWSIANSKNELLEINNSEMSYSYEYDKNGNWIKKYVHKEEEPKELFILRKIVY